MIILVKLSPREAEVLDLFDRGLLYKQIAARLHISQHTVIEYRDRILVKTLVNFLDAKAVGYPETRILHKVSMRQASYLRRQPA
jgi:DNA-binding NarL/FixJ family response regulator